jgi:cytochrome oxidase Cu insertion factor (SCO1/SenC/PrrC family)
MRWVVVLALLLAVSPVGAFAQRKKKNEDAFPREKPTVGETLPDLVVYDVRGHEVNTASLRGHYTVLTFGCLT